MWKLDQKEVIEIKLILITMSVQIIRYLMLWVTILQLIEKLIRAKIIRLILFMLLILLLNIKLILLNTYNNSNFNNSKNIKCNNNNSKDQTEIIIKTLLILSINKRKRKLNYNKKVIKFIHINLLINRKDCIIRRTR